MKKKKKTRARPRPRRPKRARPRASHRAHPKASRPAAGGGSAREEKQAVEALVRRLRTDLKEGGSPAHARRVQMFFRVPVEAYGWRTDDVRRLAAGLRKEILAEGDGQRLLAVAEQLFTGTKLEEATAAVALLEGSVKEFGPAEFKRLERWLDHIGNWSDCDALAGSLLGPLIVAHPRLLKAPFAWARKRHYWHRRAAAVALVPSARKGLHTREILRLAASLLNDKEYMVQKGVGWLLREAAKATRVPVAKFLTRVRRTAPRLVLRTACETLPIRERRRILYGGTVGAVTAIR